MTGLHAAYERERAAYRRVVRWRALYYSRRVAKAMRELHPVSAIHLHYRLKDAEYAAIEEHQNAERCFRQMLIIETGGRA